MFSTVNPSPTEHITQCRDQYKLIHVVYMHTMHLQEGTMAGVLTYAQETALSKRVREWEEKIKPKLVHEVM